MKVKLTDLTGRIISKKKQHAKNKVGKPPGTLIYSGEKISKEVRVNILRYGEDLYEFEEVKTLDKIEEALKLHNGKQKLWLNVIGLTDVDFISSLGKLMGLHPLVMEDILNVYQRPKLDNYENYIFTVMKRINFKLESPPEFDNYSFILKNNIVVSFQDSHDDYFGEVYSRIKNGMLLFRKINADYLYYVLHDVIVDNYYVAGEELYEKIEALQEDLMFKPEKDDLGDIQSLKKEISNLRTAIRPARDTIASLISEDVPAVSKEVSVYLKDTLDHHTQIVETIESYRDSITGLMDLYLSSVSNKMNEVMKVLTIIATIFIPLTFIAGVYGMNFKSMPELEWEYGYPVVMAFMLVVGIALGYYFKKKHWL